MLEDMVLLFVTTTGTAIVVGSLSMHTLQSFVEKEFMTLAFSVITAGDFICAMTWLQ